MNNNGLQKGMLLCAAYLRLYEGIADITSKFDIAANKELAERSNSKNKTFKKEIQRKLLKSGALINYENIAKNLEVIENIRNAIAHCNSNSIFCGKNKLTEANIIYALDCYRNAILYQYDLIQIIANTYSQEDERVKAFRLHLHNFVEIRDCLMILENAVLNQKLYEIEEDIDWSICL